MFTIIRIASAAAFLVIALGAAVAQPISSVPAAVASTESRSAMEIAAVRAKHAGHIAMLPVFVVRADAPRAPSIAGSASHQATVLTAQVRRALPRLRLDVPYYSFGGSAGTRAAE